MLRTGNGSVVEGLDLLYTAHMVIVVMRYQNGLPTQCCS